MLTRICPRVTCLPKFSRFGNWCISSIPLHENKFVTYQSKKKFHQSASTLKADESNVQLTQTVPIKPSPFADLGLNSQVITTIENVLGWKYPTRIQSQVLPMANLGKHVVASAWTGQGKTGAFMIPVINRIVSTEVSESSIKLEANERQDMRYVRPRAIILTPSSELARQVAEQFNLLGKPLGVKTSLIINEKTLGEQLCDLSTNTDVIVSTPGRLAQHLQYVQTQRDLNFADFTNPDSTKPQTKAIISMSRLEQFVIDECDKLLSLGFLPDVLKTFNLASELKKVGHKANIQVMIFSATLVDEVHSFIIKLAPHHKLFDLNQNLSIPKTVKLIRYEVTNRRKLSLLLYFLRRKGNVSMKGKKVLVFVRTIQRCDRLVERLKENGFSAEALHSEVSLLKRENTLSGIKNSVIQIIVATDIATRGIDLPDLEYVVNFDLPYIPADFVHRAGRVGRAGRNGVCLSFVSKEPEIIQRPNGPDVLRDEQALMQSIEKLLDLSKNDNNAARLEYRKIPGPFLDVAGFRNIKAIASDPRYRDLVEHADLDSPVSKKGSNTIRNMDTSYIPKTSYGDLMNDFTKRDAKVKGVIVKPNDMKLNLHKRN